MTPTRHRTRVQRSEPVKALVRRRVCLVPGGDDLDLYGQLIDDNQCTTRSLF